MPAAVRLLASNHGFSKLFSSTSEDSVGADSAGGIFEDLLFNNMGHEVRISARAGPGTGGRHLAGKSLPRHGPASSKLKGTGVGRRRLEVRVPAGVKTGSRVRVAGEGQSGIAGGARGDLYLIVNILSHEPF